MRALKPQKTPPAELTGRDSVPQRTRRAGRSPLGALESLALSKIDGRRTIADLAALVGVSATEMSVMLGRLSDLDVVRLGGPPSNPNDSEDMPTLQPE